jgi:hypothetical protein
MTRISSCPPLSPNGDVRLPAVPTTSYAKEPTRMVLPTGSTFGKSALVGLSPRTATARRWATSDSVKNRPVESFRKFTAA